MKKTYWWLYLGDCQTKQEEIDNWDKEGFTLFVSKENKGEDDYFETDDEPDWDDVEEIVKQSGFIPEYDGWSSECSITFVREEQEDKIKRMSWDEVYDLILEKFNCRVIRN
jgi:hypothetical protein